MITQTGLRNLLEVMELMAANERLIGDFYQACARTWEEDRTFWLDIAAEEEKHAQYIERMTRIVSLRPDHFEIGRLFNKTAIQTIMNGIKGHLKRLRKRAITRNQAINVARDLELSIIEKNFGEILRTTDVEYLTLVKEIEEDTRQHRNSIEQRMRELKTGATA